MKYKTKTRAGFSLVVLVGVIGVLVVLVAGGVYVQKNIVAKKAPAEKPQESTQATSTIALSSLVDVRQQGVSAATSGISMQNAKRGAVENIANAKEIEDAIKRFFEYKKEANTIVDWKTYKAVWLKYGTRDWLNSLNKGGDTQWQYMYNNGGKEYLDKAPQISEIDIIKKETKESLEGEKLVRIGMTEKNKSRQGEVVLTYEEGIWKVGGEYWPSY